MTKKGQDSLQEENEHLRKMLRILLTWIVNNSSGYTRSLGLEVFFNKNKEIKDWWDKESKEK